LHKTSETPCGNKVELEITNRLCYYTPFFSSNAIFDDNGSLVACMELGFANKFVATIWIVA